MVRVDQEVDDPLKDQNRNRRQSQPIEIHRKPVDGKLSRSATVRAIDRATPEPLGPEPCASLVNPSVIDPTCIYAVRLSAAWCMLTCSNSSLERRPSR